MNALSAIDVIGAEPPNAPPKPEVIGYAVAEELAPTLRPHRPGGRVLPSEIDGVSNDQWTDFVLAMKVAELSSISPSNGVGMFDMRYKRLADMGLVTNLRYRQTADNRSVQEGDWVKPLTLPLFLRSARVQLRVFSESMQDYVAGLRSGEVSGPPDGMADGTTMSGMLAILHRGGPSALKKWNEQKFPQTVELFRRINGVF